MPMSPFSNAIPGQPRGKPSAAAHNELMRIARLLSGGLLKDDGRPGDPETSTIIKIKNLTGAQLGRFGVVGIGNSIVTDTASAEFRNRLVMQGNSPSTTATVAIANEPLAANAFGDATVLGLTPCQVNLTDTSHRYAAPTTLTTKLTSQAGVGAAKILWIDGDFGATGTKWAVVLLENAAPPHATFVRFTLGAALLTTDASTPTVVSGSHATVDGYWGGADPGSAIQLYNLPASSNYIFSGASGNKGLGTWDDVNQKWWIIQMQCP